MPYATVESAASSGFSFATWNSWQPAIPTKMALAWVMAHVVTDGENNYRKLL